MANVSIANDGKIMEGQEMNPAQQYLFETLKPRLEGPLDELRRLTFELCMAKPKFISNIQEIKYYSLMYYIYCVCLILSFTC